MCIHLACKWSNWEIPVSTDRKHWWEYVDPSVTLELLDELTHKFLQILEKMPSRLKRIRNWRATQAAKRPKCDGQSADSAYPSPFLIHEHSVVDIIPGVSASATFPKTLSFPIGLPSNSGGVLSLDSIANMHGVPYTFTAPSDWPQDALSVHCKSTDFPPGKQVHKTEGGRGKHQPITFPLPIALSHKMSLDKYREKHVTELAMQKQRQEQSLEVELRDTYPPPTLIDPHHHRKPHSNHQQALGCSSAPTASPHKMKLSLQEGAKRGKANSLNLHIPIPPINEGGARKEELKMNLKVSASEHHSSSDEGGAKRKHSKHLVVKHRKHSAHWHHKHGHTHPHQHSGNGRGGTEGPASVVPALRSSVGCNKEGVGPGSSSFSSSWKRVHRDACHNHHSKTSKSSKSTGGLWTSHEPSETEQEASGEPWP